MDGIPGERCVWTLVARHPVHASDEVVARQRARHMKAELDDYDAFREALVSIARQVAPAHTSGSVIDWLPGWELEVYRKPDDVTWKRCYIVTRGGANDENRRNNS